VLAPAPQEQSPGPQLQLHGARQRTASSAGFSGSVTRVHSLPVLARSRTPRRGPRRSTRSRTATADQPQKEEAVVMDAVVSKALPNAMFEVELENQHKLIAYAAGRMRRYFIRITPGDRIRVELSPYDLTRGRIVYRYRD